MVTPTKLPAPAPPPKSTDRPDDLTGRSHRQLIGYIGLLLPALLIVLAIWRDGLEQWRALESVSAYYYSGAAAAFIGMLVSLALYLFTYSGYENERGKADRWVATIAAVAALGVAIFPTEAPAGTTPLTWWTNAIGVVHSVSATILFAMFAVFALWLFRLSAKGKKIDDDKKRRNLIYLICGVIIVVAMIWAWIEGRASRPIFWPESVALVAFAVSWLVKGHVHKEIRKRLRSMMG